MNVDEMHGAMHELMKHQKSLILKKHHEIAKQYMELKVINQHYKFLTNDMDFCLFNASSLFFYQDMNSLKKIPCVFSTYFNIK